MMRRRDLEKLGLSAGLAFTGGCPPAGEAVRPTPIEVACRPGDGDEVDYVVVGSGAGGGPVGGASAYASASHHTSGSRCLRAAPQAATSVIARTHAARTAPAVRRDMPGSGLLSAAPTSIGVGTTT